MTLADQFRAAMEEQESCAPCCGCGTVKLTLIEPTPEQKARIIVAIREQLARERMRERKVSVWRRVWAWLWAWLWEK